MSYLIVSDSSSNLFKIEGENYKTVPLHIMIGDTDWADTADVDMDAFDEALYSFDGKTSSSCPSPDEWLESFGDAETVFCFTITHGLSGSYNGAMTAKSMYEEHHPGRHVYVIDSLATGPKMVLMIEYLRDQLANGADPETAYNKTLEYRSNTGLLFTLQSIQMLAKAGRVSPFIAKAVGLLDMRMIGEANDEGKIDLVGKHRGYKKTLLGTFKQMLNLNYNGGKVVISHNRNEQAANDLAALIREKFGDVLIDIHRTGILCSYYAEKGGFIVGFERSR
ncbi:MAG: DegV family protein [Eubacteriales bacterium]|nr:DegV family protein [Eubacteriales bacterium]